MKKTLLSIFIIAGSIMTMGLFAQTPIFINEIHYDNSGADVNEGVEIAGPASTDLTGWMLFYYNGSNGAQYGSDTIKVSIPDQQNGFGTIWTAHPASIQNGSPDGVALVNPSNEVIQFLSYEGTLTATNGPANGMTSVDIGVSENGSGAIDQSIQLTGQGETYEDFVWVTDLSATNGAVNTNQIFGSLPEPDNHVTDLALSTKTFSRITLTWTDAIGTNLASSYLVKAAKSGETISSPVDGIAEYDSKFVRNVNPGEQTVMFSSLDGNQAYDFLVFSYSNSNLLIDYKTDGTIPTITATTDGADTIVLFEDFEFDPKGWFPVSDSGDQEWDLIGPGADGTNRSANINGYNGPDAINVDWAFSPPMNLDAWSGEVLTFYNQWKFGTMDEKEYLKLFYSTDYNGLEGGHMDATWTELAFDSSATAETWHLTSDIDVSGISGQNVRFGFKYRSDDNQRSWWVDEFMVKGTFTGETAVPQWKTGYPKTDDVRSEQLDVVMNINEAGNVFFLLKGNGDPAPSVMEVKMGDTMMVVNGGQDYSTTLYGLAPNTSYDIYFIAEDALGNTQDTTVLVQATTTDPRAIEMTFPVSGTFYVGDTLTMTWTSAGIDSLSLWALADTDKVWFNVLDGSNLFAGTGSLDLPIGLDAGVDSVILKLADYQDTTFNSKSGMLYLTDTIRPVLQDLFPRNNSVDAGLGTVLYMALNEEVQPVAGNVTIYLSDGTPVESVDVTSDQIEIYDYRIVIRLSGSLDISTSYYVLVDNGTFEDYQGNTFAGISDNAKWTFTTIGQEIFFSEYIEGSSNNKALEIYNPTGSDVDLSSYQLKRANNGAPWVSGSTYSLSGTLKADSVFVICNAQASDEIKGRSDSIGGPLGEVTFFNGDDALGIFKFNGNDWILIDAIGTNGEDPGSAWDVAGVNGATANHTLIRKDFITTGNENWVISSGTNAFNSEWKVMEMDYSGNLGLKSPVSDSLADIKSFVLNEQDSEAVIDSAAATVDIVVALGTEMDSLFPVIIVSDGAMIEPASGDSVDFSGGPVIFKVTAENKVDTRDWTVTVTESLVESSKKKILSFVLDKETKAAVIDTVNFTVTAEVEYGTALTALAPVITVSAMATIDPMSGVAQDFSGGAVNYTVTAQDMSTRVWAVTVAAVAPIEVANLAALRAGIVDDKTLYKVIGESVLTFQQDYYHQKIVQDATAGMLIHDPDGIITTTYNPGNGITGIVGTLHDYFGMLELYPVADPGAASSSGNTIEAQTITVSEFTSNFENYENELIRIDSVDFADGGGTFANNSNYVFSRDGGSSVLRVHFFESGVDGTAIPAKANITGIATWHFSEAKVAPISASGIEAVTIIDNVNDLLSDDMLKVYPNPSSGMITLELSRDAVADLEVEIFSLNGKMVYRNSFRSVNNIQEQIDLSKVARGIYMLRLRSEDEVSMHKLVIQ